MALLLPFTVITPIPDTEPEAVPSLWNTRYSEIDANFRRIANYTGFGVSSSSPEAAEKAVQIDGFSLTKGASVAVQFDQANTAAAPVLLNVSGTGAREIWQDGQAIDPDALAAGAILALRFDGLHWVAVGGGSSANSIGKVLLSPDPVEVFDKIYGTSSGDLVGYLLVREDPFEPDPVETFDDNYGANNG